MIEKSCMRHNSGVCRADGLPCKEVCAQFASCDVDVFESLTANMTAREKKSSRKPISTWYEVLKGTASSAATHQDTQNRYAVQNILTIGQATAEDKQAVQMEESNKWGF